MTTIDTSLHEDVDECRATHLAAFDDFTVAVKDRRRCDDLYRTALEQNESAVRAAKAAAHSNVTSESPTKHRIGDRTVSTAERDLYFIEYVNGAPDVVATKAAEQSALEARDALTIAEKRLSAAREDMRAAVALLEAVTR